MLHSYVTDMAARVTPTTQIPVMLHSYVTDMAARVTPTVQIPTHLQGGSVEIGDSLIGSHCSGISMLPQVLKVTPFYGTYLSNISPLLEPEPEPNKTIGIKAVGTWQSRDIIERSTHPTNKQSLKLKLHRPTPRVSHRAGGRSGEGAWRQMLNAAKCYHILPVDCVPLPVGCGVECGAPK